MFWGLNIRCRHVYLSAFGAYFTKWTAEVCFWNRWHNKMWQSEEREFEDDEAGGGVEGRNRDWVSHSTHCASANGLICHATGTLSSPLRLCLVHHSPSPPPYLIRSRVEERERGGEGGERCLSSGGYSFFCLICEPHLHLKLFLRCLVLFFCYSGSCLTFTMVTLLKRVKIKHFKIYRMLYHMCLAYPLCGGKEGWMVDPT